MAKPKSNSPKNTNGAKSKKTEAGYDDELDPDYMCGIGPFKPKWLQRLANKKAYVLAYCTLSLCQGMFYTYMVSVLSTIEKRFAVSSKVSGIIMTGNEFSQIIFAVFVAYFGSRGHRPRWIALGMYISAASCFIIALPEFLFPGNKALLMSFTNSSARDVCHGANWTQDQYCSDDADNESFAAMALIFIGLFVSGIGSLAIYSLGFPYMDDNVGKKQAPAYLGITIGLRVVGPASGYMLGGATLRRFHDPKQIPDYGPYDPRWVGAWWMGFMAIGCAIAFLSCFMLLFPRELRKTPAVNKPGEKPPTAAKSGLSVIGIPARKDLPLALKRVCTNKLLIAYCFDASFWLLGGVGFGTYMPKYFEAKFGESASGASFVTGLSSVFVMMFGFIGSGFVIQRFKPRPRILMGYSCFISCIHIAVLIGMMYLKCEGEVTVHGTVVDNNLEIIELCNQNCQCTTEKYTPVCDIVNDVTYFTACHLGCNEYNQTSKQYSHCSCADVNADVIQAGKCPTVCTAFLTYVIIMTIMRFLNSTERIGGTLVFFRSMEPRDKSLAAGMFNALLCITAFLPATVVYGSVVDKACLVWEESCGERGNCWLYDTELLGYWLHGLTAALFFASLILEIFVWYYCKDINLFDDDDPNYKSPTADAEKHIAESIAMTTRTQIRSEDANKEESQRMLQQEYQA